MRLPSFGGALAFAVITGAVVSGPGWTSAAKAEVSYKGKRIVWIVPSREGGGSDNFTRAIVPHLARHLPGKPTIVIRNIPGTGTMPGTNQFVEQAKGDGLMIITNSTSAIMNQVLKNKAVRYDLSKMRTVIAVPQGTFLYASPQTGLKSPDDIGMLIKSGKTYRFGGYSATSAELRALVSWEILGINVKPLWGMSRGKARQAFMRGEAEFSYDTASSWFKKVLPLVRAKEAVPMMTFGVQDENGGFVRDPVAPDLPHFNEVYEKVHGKKLSGAAFEAWQALFYLGVMSSKSIALPESAKPEVVDTYVKAVSAMLADPKFKKAKEKELGPYRASFGKAADAIMDKAVNMKPEARAWLRNYLKTKHNVDLES